jgi:hypothetical protein
VYRHGALRPDWESRAYGNDGVTFCSRSDSRWSGLQVSHVLKRLGCERHHLCKKLFMVWHESVRVPVFCENFEGISSISLRQERSLMTEALHRSIIPERSMWGVMIPKRVPTDPCEAGLGQGPASLNGCRRRWGIAQGVFAERVAECQIYFKH